MNGNLQRMINQSYETHFFFGSDDNIETQLPSVAISSTEESIVFF